MLSRLFRAVSSRARLQQLAPLLRRRLPIYSNIIPTMARHIFPVVIAAATTVILCIGVGILLASEVPQFAAAAVAIFFFCWLLFALSGKLDEAKIDKKDAKKKSC